MPNRPNKIGQPVARPQENRAEQPEVGRPAQQAEQRPVNPHLPAPGPLGPEEQHAPRRQPEQQVQRRPQKLPPHPDPQNPEQVIQHPQGRPDGQGLAQGRPLGRHINSHPPNRRLSSPPRSRRSLW